MVAWEVRGMKWSNIIWRYCSSICLIQSKTTKNLLGYPGSGMRYPLIK